MCMQIDAVLFAENEQRVQKMESELNRVCETRNLRVNAEKSKVIAFERKA